MEKLTFASLAHLPTAVIFVIDPTGLSGEKSTLTAQLNVRKHLKERFPKRPWIDVVSKGELFFFFYCAFLSLLHDVNTAIIMMRIILITKLIMVMIIILMITTMTMMMIMIIILIMMILTIMIMIMMVIKMMKTPQ